MKTDTKQQLLDYLKENTGVSPAKIAAHLAISPQMAHRHLKALLEAGLIKKLGAPPRVIYQLVSEVNTYQFPQLNEQTQSYLDQNYLQVKPDGEVIEGVKAFD